MNGAGVNKSKQATLITAAVMFALALTMLMLVLFAPFQYYSDEDDLHIIFIESAESDTGEKVEAYVYQNGRVHQSMLRIFAAAGALGDASVLNAAADGLITDETEYRRARDRLKELTDTRLKIYQQTRVEAAGNGYKAGSEEFRDLLIDNLSGMDLMALDLLETAAKSDNGSVYRMIFGGVITSLVLCILELVIAVVSLIVLAFSVIAFVGRKPCAFDGLFLQLYAALSATGLLSCVFNPLLLPSAGPLALACVAVCVYYAAGVSRAVLGGINRADVKNMIVGAALPVAMLCLAAVPSLTLRVTGLADQYMYYPGSVGTVHYSHIKAEMSTTVSIPHGAILASFLLGVPVGILSVICAVRALGRLYARHSGRDDIMLAAIILTVAVGIAIAITVGSLSAGLHRQDRKVGYTTGASWYLNIGFMLACAIYMAVSDRRDQKRALSSSENAEGAPAAFDAEQAEPETADAINAGGADTDVSVNADATAHSGSSGNSGGEQ